MLLAADISSHNAITDWAAFLGSIDILIVKISEGTGYTWLGAPIALAQARNAGKLVGAFHFASATDPVAEADYFLAHYSHQPGEVIVLDWEPATPPADPDGWCAAWCSEVMLRTGVVPMVYMNGPTARSSTWAKTRALNCGLWIAYYGTNTGSVPSTQPAVGSWGSYAMWQYTSQGTLPGVSGPIDLSQFYGTAAAWKAYGLSKEDPSVKNLILGQRKSAGDPAVWVGDGLVRRRVADETELTGLQYWIGQKGGDPKVYDIGDLRVLGEPLQADLTYVRDQMAGWIGGDAAGTGPSKLLQAVEAQATPQIDDAKLAADLASNPTYLAAIANAVLDAEAARLQS